MKPKRAALVGLAIGSAAAVVAAMGPLYSATLITIGVETQVGAATGLPDPRLLPLALEGLGAVALAYLVTFAPKGRLGQWCKGLIAASLIAGMLAQGAHAVFYSEATRALVLPWGVKLLISFVPPASGMAALHLVVKAAEGLIGAVRALHAFQTPAARAVAQERALTAPASTPKLAPEPRAPRADSAPKRAASGTRADQVRALLAEPGGRALTGREIGERLGIDAGRARSLRAEVERESADSPTPARRPRVVVGTEAEPAAASAIAQEA